MQVTKLVTNKLRRSGRIRTCHLTIDTMKSVVVFTAVEARTGVRRGGFESLVRFKVQTRPAFLKEWCA